MDAVAPNGSAMGEADSVQSVTGSVPVSGLGFILPHEHLLIDQTWVLALADWPLMPADETITLANLGAIRRRSHSLRTNLLLDDPGIAARELSRYRESGGTTIVDLTPAGLGRDPAALALLARDAGVTIISGTGYYKQTTHPPDLRERPTGQLVAEFLEHLSVGIEGTGVRAGVIGEIGLGSPPHPEELRVLQAAAAAAHEGGRPLWIHFSDGWASGPLSSRSYRSTPGSKPARSGPIAVETIRKENLDPARVVLCHMDLTADEADYQGLLADLGANLEFDTFGAEWGKEEWHSPMPTDLQRIAAIRRLIDHGHGSQVLISHDVCTKVQLSAYGGHGFTYIRESVIPLMLARGFTEAEVDLITRRNPARLLGPDT